MLKKSADEIERMPPALLLKMIPRNPLLVLMAVCQMFMTDHPETASTIPKILEILLQRLTSPCSISSLEIIKLLPYPFWCNAIQQHDNDKGIGMVVNGELFVLCDSHSSMATRKIKLEMMVFLITETCLLNSLQMEPPLYEADADFEEFLLETYRKLDVLRSVPTKLSKLCIFKIRECVSCRNRETLEDLGLPSQLLDLVQFKAIIKRVQELFKSGLEVWGNKAEWYSMSHYHMRILRVHCFPWSNQH